MRHYAKLLGLRAWKIVWRPFWAIIVGVGVVYTFLQVVAHLLAERLVSMFDDLYQWDPFYQWWYVPLAVVILSILLRAGYELWRDERQAREKLRAENEVLKEELQEAQSDTGKMSTKQLQRENERLKTENERLRAEIPKPQDEELIQRCRHWSNKLLPFLEQRARQEPPAGIWSGERASYNNETIAQYNQQFAGPIGALLNDLEMRGWCTAKERKTFENPIMPMTIQQIANRLAAIGHK